MWTTHFQSHLFSHWWRSLPKKGSHATSLMLLHWSLLAIIWINSFWMSPLSHLLHCVSHSLTAFWAFNSLLSIPPKDQSSLMHPCNVYRGSTEKWCNCCCLLQCFIKSSRYSLVDGTSLMQHAKLSFCNSEIFQAHVSRLRILGSSSLELSPFSLNVLL